MPLLQEKTYTIDDIYNLPEGTRAELLDGNIYYMAPPSVMHQKISGSLYTKIYNYIEKNQGKCEVFAAPFAVYLDESTNTYVEPDISVICNPDKLDDKGYNGAPDWIIEIVSPSSRIMDYHKKLFKYRLAGVREYWVVDPDKTRIMVYNFDNETTEEYSFGEPVQVGIYEDLALTIQ